jgi:hypothetical protein
MISRELVWDERYIATLGEVEYALTQEPEGGYALYIDGECVADGAIASCKAAAQLHADEAVARMLSPEMVRLLKIGIRDVMSPVDSGYAPAIALLDRIAKEST